MDETNAKLLKQFAELGIEMGDDGKWRVPKELVEQVRDRARESARSLTLPTVPRTPPLMIREASGLAISRGSNRPALSLQALRDSRERGILFRPIHRARQYQIRRLCRQWYGDKTKVGLFVTHKDHWRPGFRPPDGFDKYVRQFERVLWRPMGAEDPMTLADNLAPLWEDFATLNRPVVEPRTAIIDQDTVLQWKWVDGALIWPTMLFEEFWWDKHPEARGMLGLHRGRITTSDRLEALSAYLNVELQGRDYVCVVNGSAIASYRKGELLVAPQQNRTDVTFTGYPMTHVEEVIELAKVFLDSFDFSAVQLSKGSFAQQIIGLPWDLPAEHFHSFADSFRESSQGVQRAGQPLFMPMPPGDQKIQVVPLAPPLNEMGFQALLSVCMSLATATYRMHPSTINVRPWEGGSGHSLNQGSQVEEIGLAQEEGLQGDMEHLIDAILNPLAIRCHPDLRVMAWYGDYDAQKEAAIIAQRTQTIMTLNEARVAEGARPQGFWLSDEEYDAADDAKRQKHDDNPYNHIMPIAMAKLQAQQQQQAMQAQQQMQQQAMAQQQAQGGGQEDDAQGADDYGQDEDPSQGYDAGDGYGPRQPREDGFDPYQPLGKASTERVVTVHIHREPIRRRKRSA